MEKSNKEVKPQAAQAEILPAQAPVETTAEEIARLKAELAMERQARASAEDAATRQLADLQSAALTMASIKEVPAGTIQVPRRKANGDVVTKRVAVLEPDGSQRVDEETGRKMWEDQEVTDEVPAYWYKISLPPSAGEFLSVNGQRVYHDQTYKFTSDSLRTIKEVIYRSWAHEKSISGDNENVYRPKLNAVAHG